MSAEQIEELRGLINQVDLKVKSLDRKAEDQRELTEKLIEKLDIIMTSLRRYQKRHYVDNPPGRWRGLGRALLAFTRVREPQTTEDKDGE